MKYLAFFLAVALRALAVTFSGDTAISPGYSVAEAATVTPTGTLTLSAPGTYSAASWLFQGDLAFASAGTYTLNATAGNISFAVTSTAIARSGVVSLVLAATGQTGAPGSSRGTVSVSTATLTQQNPGGATTPPLVNLSVRATLAAGQTITPAFVVGGTAPRRVLVRAIGPTLAAFGVTTGLAAPAFTVFAGSATVATANTAWGGGAALSAAFTAVGAFALPAGSRDAAAVLTLSPGAYTVQVGGGAGEVLCEVYFVD